MALGASFRTFHLDFSVKESLLVFLSLLEQIWMKVRGTATLFFVIHGKPHVGTSFVTSTINLTEKEEKAYVIGNFSPPGIPGRLLDRLFELYPNDLAFGAPHNTGNETFNLADSFKRMAGLCQLITTPEWLMLIFVYSWRSRLRFTKKAFVANGC